ncbi:ferredoxin [bacterium]|nr:ferredoxin [bacterium]
MRVKVDEDLCISCGVCIEICPDVFEETDEGKTVAAHPENCETSECCEEAAESCPTEAIIIEEDD